MAFKCSRPEPGSSSRFSSVEFVSRLDFHVSLGVTIQLTLSTVEFIGYIARAVCWSESPGYTLGPYIMQSIMLLVAPALLAASVYMELARIVLMAGGDAHLFIRRTWLTRIFVAGDVLSFLMQATGAGMMGAGQQSMTDLGEIIVIVGLVFQLIFFGLFVVAGAFFHWRLLKVPTEKSGGCPWKKHMYSLYGVSALIFVRCVVRAVEYGQGFNGKYAINCLVVI